MTTEETKRDALGRFVEGNHAGGVRQRIDALERERADLRRDLAAVEADRDTWKKQLVIFKECAAEANTAREAAEQWKEALIDEAVNYWCLNEENKDNPHLMLRDVIMTVIEWENDPAISEPAAKRKEALEAAERELATAHQQVIGTKALEDEVLALAKRAEAAERERDEARQLLDDTTTQLTCGVMAAYAMLAMHEGKTPDDEPWAPVSWQVWAEDSDEVIKEVATLNLPAQEEGT